MEVRQGHEVTAPLCQFIVGQGDPGSVEAYAVEVELGPGFWSTLILSGGPSIYGDLATARKRARYLRVRVDGGPKRPTRVVKITVTREEV